MDNAFVTSNSPTDLTLNPGHVHVWTVSLEPPAGLFQHLENALSPEEQQRAARFRFDIHRNRFIAGRGLLRFILSLYLRLPPGQIEFVEGHHGKPSLPYNLNPDDLQFNLAHSDSLALLAVSRSGPVGIDIERIHPPETMDQLVARFFAPGESRLFWRLPARLKPIAFFNLWTRKEAWLKATGEGIAHFLKEVEVSFLPGETARLLHLPAEFASDCQWSLHDLNAVPGFAAALAVAHEAPVVMFHRWKFPGIGHADLKTNSESCQDSFSPDQPRLKREHPLCQT